MLRNGSLDMFNLILFDQMTMFITRTPTAYPQQRNRPFSYETQKNAIDPLMKLLHHIYGNARYYVASEY